MNPNGHRAGRVYVSHDPAANVAVMMVGHRIVDQMTDADITADTPISGMFYRHLAALQWWLEGEGE